MKLRRILLAIVCLFGFMFITTPMEANAADAWVYSYTSERTGQRTDCYVMTESIHWSADLLGLRCRVKNVVNGRVIAIENWRFLNMGPNHWRYEVGENSRSMSLVWPNDLSDKILQLAFNYV